MTKSIKTLKADLASKEAALDLHALIGYHSTFRALLIGRDEAQRIAAFGEMLEKQGGTDKAAYLAVRDQLRDALRNAEAIQKARRALEKALKAEGETTGLAFHNAYGNRMRARWLITNLIAVRRAGKAWAAQAHAASLTQDAA